MHTQRPSYDGYLTKQRDPLAFKADAAKGILAGDVSKFWVVDSYAEATAPGSFAKTIAERGPQGSDRILLRYEHAHTIGKHLSMTETERGLAIEARASDDGMFGTAVRRQLADEVPYGLSIGFRRVRDRSGEDDDPLDFSSAPEWVKTLPRNEIRILIELKLFENSVVSFPAVDPALVDSYRADDGATLHSLLRDLKAGTLTAEQRVVLAEIVAAWPADTAPDDGETPSTPRDARTAVRRNYLAELALMGIDCTERRA